MNPVQVVSLNLHHAITGNQNKGYFALVDVAPLNTVGQWGDGWGTRVLDSVVLKVAGYDHAPPK